MASSKTPQQQLAEETYKNWLKGVLVTRQLKEGIQCFLQTELEKVHAHLLSVVQARIQPRSLPTSCTCSSADLKRIRHICPLGICNLLLQEISARHQYGVANLHDTDPTKWLDRTQPWEVAKCYLSNGYRLVTSAAETDCTGLLSLVINCTTLHGKLHENVAVQPNLFTEVRDLRNATMHSPDLSLEEAQLKDLMKKALAILGDKIALKKDVNCQAAAARITEIQSGALAITLQDELIVLEEIRKASENISTVQEIKKRVEALELIKADVTNVKTDVGQVTTRICNVETDVGQIKTDVNNVSTDVGYVKTDVNEVKTDVLQVTTQIRKMETDVGQVKTDVGRVKTDVGRVKTDVGQVTTDVGQVKADVGQVKTQVGQVKTDMGQAKADVGQVKTDMGQVKTQVDQVKTDVGQVKTQVGQVKTDIGQVKTDVGQVKTEVGQVKTHIRKMEMDVGQVKTDVNEVKREIDQVSANVGQVKTDIGQIKTHGAKVQTDLFLVKTAVGQVNTDIRKVKQNVGKVKTHISKMETDVNAKLFDFKTIVSGVKTDVDDVKTDVDQVKRGVQPLVEYIKSQQPWLQITPEDETEFKHVMIEKVTKQLDTVNVCDWCWDIKIKDIYTPLRRRHDLEKDVFGNRQHDNLTRKHRTENKLIESEDEIFMKNGQQQFDIYVIGKAGIGKTFFLRKLFQSWCRLQTSLPASKLDHILAKFDFVFHVSLRYAGKSDTLREMIYRQACYQIKQHITVAQEVLQSRDKHCLILVDGLDEWEATASAVSSPSSQPGIPDREGLGRNCTVLTTSRPWRVEALEKGLGHDCRMLEIEGLDKDGVLELSERLLGALKDPDHVASAKVFYKEIIELRMEELVKIPLMLANIVVSWHRNGHKLDKSLCMNYSGMFESLIQRALDSGSDRKSQASVGQAHEVPPCFAGRLRCLQFWSLIQKLSHLAFHSLLGQEKERALVFDKQDLVDQFGETDLEECLKFGILSQSEGDLESNDRKVSVSFLHKTLQEFLAALYMSTSSWESCLKTFQDRCETVGDVLDLQLIIIFLSGLAPDRGSELCLHVLNLVGEDEWIQQYRRAIGEVLDSTRSHGPALTVVGLQSMLLDCAREAGCSHTDLSKQQLARMYPIPDIYVDIDIRPDACEMLYSYATLNASSIQSLVFKDKIDTPRVIMEAVKDMTHLQRLEVRFPPQQVVSYIEQLCQSLPKLQRLQALGLTGGNRLFAPSVPLECVETLLDSVPSIISLYLAGLDVDSKLHHVAVTGGSRVECQSRVNLVSFKLEGVFMSSNLLPLVTTRSLRSVDLSHVTLAHTQIEALCGFLAASTSLQRLVLWHLSCRDCGDQCQSCLDLSAVEQLQKLWLSDLRVTRLSLDSRELEDVVLYKLSGLEMGGLGLTCLTTAPKLWRLQVKYCSLSPRDVSTLVTSLSQLQQLEELRLSGISFGDQDAVTVSNMSKLRRIDFWSVTMSASSWRQFLHTLPRHQLKVTLCCECNVDEETMAAICSSPRYKVTLRQDTGLEFLTVPQTAQD